MAKFINRNNDESTEVIETIITNISSSLKSFNKALKREIKKVDPNILPEYIELLTEYKPLTIKEMQNIPFLIFDDIKGLSKQILLVIKNMLKQFLSKYDELIALDFDTRYAMENVLLRNIDISESNPFLDMNNEKNKLEIHNIEEFDKKEFVGDYLKGSGKIQSRWINKNPDKEYKYKLEKTDATEKLFNEQREFISLWGRNTLYLSAYKMKGKISLNKRELNIDAPLLFIPIVLVENDESYHVYFDEDREVKINNHIIVANNSLNEVNTIINKLIFIQIKNRERYEIIERSLNDYYLENGINITSSISGENKFEIVEEYYIGMFPVYKDSTHYDLDSIITDGFITENIAEMFSVKDADYKTSVINGELNQRIQDRIMYLKQNGEYEVSPISKLNYPQEQAIKNLNVYGNIVIQGPPGTGKTETIVSIISDAILRNKKVLVSSEKHVALDVIYSRLKELAKYSILLNDIKDTSKFYDQLQLMIEESMNDKVNQTNTSLIMSDNEIMFRRNETRVQIVEFIKTYEDIFRYLRANEIGKTYSFLYKHHSIHRTTDNNIKKILEKSNIFNIIKTNKLFTSRLYDVLFMLNEKFSYKKDNSEFDIDKAVIAKYPFLLTHTKKTVTSTKLAKVFNDVQRLDQDDIFDDYGFKKMFLKILRKIFNDPEHLYSYIQTKDELINILGIVNKKVKQIEVSVDPESRTNIFEALGSAWMLTFDEIVDYIETKGKIADARLISNIIFDNTISEILSFKEQTNPKLQEAVTNGNIGVFNKMISKLLTEIVEYNTTLTERRLRDSLLNVLSQSGKMTEIQSFIENNKMANVNKFFEDNWREIFKGVNIWLLPAKQVSAFFPLEPGMFDIIIIDEASQMVIEKAIPLMYRAKQLVISGDDKQLKPSVKQENRIFFDPEASEISYAIVPALGLQDALKNKFYSNLINYHYRSSFAELINFSNSFIYRNTLYVSTPRTYNPSNPPIEFIKIKNGKMSKRKNDTEAKELVKKLIKLIKEKPDSSIGIIAFTVEQRNAIEERLEKEAQKNEELDLFIRTNAFHDEGEDTSLFVKNVSEVQGDEREIIIFSIGFAKDSKDKYPEELGDISKQFGENRLNVAITRAKSKIIVISSIDPGDLTLPKKDIGGNLLKHFLYYAQAVSNGNDASVRRILKQNDAGKIKVFESPMHEEIYYLLKNNGYKIEYQFGFDDYKMDFVIRDKDSNEVLLGINLDNEQYLRNFNTMEREYYLPTYLEARGWNIIRLWSHQWAKDPDQENKRILQKISKSLEEKVTNTDIVSLFDMESTILDFDSIPDDPNYQPEDKTEELVEESENVISNALVTLEEIKKELKSTKIQEEEEKWLEEFKAIENLEGHPALEMDQLIEKEFLKNPGQKRVDGIEDAEIAELLLLSQPKPKKKKIKKNKEK